MFAIMQEGGMDMYVDVLIEIKAKQMNQTFTYQVPKEFEHVTIGMRVTVPFGTRNLEGFVLKKYKEKKDSTYKIKAIQNIIDDHPVLNEELLKLGKYISKKTLCNLISAYQTMLPSALKAKKGMEIHKKYETYIVLDQYEKTKVTTKSQQKIIEQLLKEKKVLKKTLTEISSSSLKKLLEKQIVKEQKEEIYRLPSNAIVKPKSIELTQEQQNVVSSVLKSQTFIPFLLHGVTGSGKTEVYMHIIEEILKQQKEVIVLVPEISLTPQMVNQFKNRFGNQIAILHSRLSDGEKYDEWRKIERKEVAIAIGARSAIFAPFTNLGLIIIDEEHTETYKQENTPKYSAIDVALTRAKYHNCPVLLGSATPSLESYTRAKAGVYQLLELKNRISKNMPQVTRIDMKQEIKQGNRIFSNDLIQSIEECLKKKEQVILLLNRRGYSTIVTCKECGHIEKCPNCDIPLIYHKKEKQLKCHYCNYAKYIITTCPECHSTEIGNMGMGTEKLEEETQKLFPIARIIRMDVDTTQKKGAHEKIIQAFKEEKYDILIGTQMIAKGLDFPKVTLVGVMNADASLNVPDFRSAERTFALLSQVAGRAGRSKLPGKVIIQGFNVEHYSIKKASTHDYQGFYQEEMKIRKKLSYPPFVNLCLVQVHGKDLEICNQEAIKIKNYLNQKLEKNGIILGPSSATMPKMNNVYYINIIIKFKKTDYLLPALQFLKEKYRATSKVGIEIDLNPIRL